MNWVILGDVLHMGYRPSAKVTLWRDPKGFYSMEVTRRLGHKRRNTPTCQQCAEDGKQGQ